MGRNFHYMMRSARLAIAAFGEAEDVLLGPLSHVPVLTIFGERNDPFGFGARWKAMFPTATEWIVQGGNHFPMCDDPTGFVRRLRSWYAAEVRPDYEVRPSYEI